jgi:hypothetical protein
VPSPGQFIGQAKNNLYLPESVLYFLDIPPQRLPGKNLASTRVVHVRSPLPNRL